MRTKERVIAMDTETTGLSFSEGHRIVEIAGIEVIGNLVTGNNYHVYLDPFPKKVDPEAFQVHGLSDEFLAGKPKFRHEYRNFLDFIGDSPLVIHNAPFDLGFINGELRQVGQPPLKNEIRDTLNIARGLYPGQKVSLDALCNRLDVDNSMREKHGALLDSELLAEVYIKMQELDRLALQSPVTSQDNQEPLPSAIGLSRRHRAVREPVFPTPEELAAHVEFIGKLKDSVWASLRQ